MRSNQRSHNQWKVWRVDCFVLYFYCHQHHNTTHTQKKTEKIQCYRCIQSHHVQCKFIAYQALQRHQAAEKERKKGIKKWAWENQNGNPPKSTAKTSLVIVYRLFTIFKLCVTAVYVWSTRDGVYILNYFVDILCTSNENRSKKKKTNFKKNRFTARIHHTARDI